MTRSRNLRRVGLFLVIALLCGYALFEARGLLHGPVIDIESPMSGQTITEPLVHIIGRTQSITAITMNDRPIFISEEGRIDERIALLPGYNEIMFKGTDRFGKMTQTPLVLMYSPQEPLVLPIIPAASSSPASTTSPMES